MAAPSPLPSSRLQADDFVGSLGADDLVYFCCNVGDADAQVVLLPEDHNGARRAVVIDAGRVGKLPAVIDALAAEGLLSFGIGSDDPTFPLALVVATHPHHDHMAGIPEVMNRYLGRIGEFWDPGYFHTLGAYTNTMRAVAAQEQLVYAQPTSGFQRWFGDTGMTVLAPSIHLRNRFDTYGVEINNASISLRFESPASRVREEEGRRTYAPRTKSATLVLGADSQTLSWSYVLTDFPYLARSGSQVAKVLRAAGGDWDALRADVLRVSHHGSKHGVNLELIERVLPKFTLISSSAGGGTYRFPHAVTQEVIREALHPSTTSGAPHPEDWELGIFYTCDTDDNDAPCGTIAAVLNPARTTLWRFGDRPPDDVDLAQARRWA